MELAAFPPGPIFDGVTDIVAVGVIDGDAPKERVAVGDDVPVCEGDGVQVELAPRVVVFVGVAADGVDGVAVGVNAAAGVGEADGVDPVEGVVVGVSVVAAIVGDGVDDADNDKVGDGDDDGLESTVDTVAQRLGTVETAWHAFDERLTIDTPAPSDVLKELQASPPAPPGPLIGHRYILPPETFTLR